MKSKVISNDIFLIEGIENYQRLFHQFKRAKTTSLKSMHPDSGRGVVPNHQRQLNAILTKKAKPWPTTRFATNSGWLFDKELESRATSTTLKLKRASKSKV